MWPVNPGPVTQGDRSSQQGWAPIWVCAVVCVHTISDLYDSISHACLWPARVLPRLRFRVTQGIGSRICATAISRGCGVDGLLHRPLSAEKGLVGGWATTAGDRSMVASMTESWVRICRVLASNCHLSLKMGRSCWRICRCERPGRL